MAQRTMPQNEATKKKHSTHNGFPMSYAVATTQRYGDIDPFFYIHTVGGDKIPLQSSHELRSHTLASPLLSGLQMHKEYFEIPMRAILPNTWELIFANPTQGDDVPSEEYNPYCSVTASTFGRFLGRLADFVLSEQNILFLHDQGNTSGINFYFKSIFLLNKLLSNGELLAKFGYRLSPTLSIRSAYYNDWDGFYNMFLSYFKSKDLSILYDNGDESKRYIYFGQSDVSSFPTESVSIEVVSFRKFIELINNDPSFAISTLSNGTWSDTDLFLDYYDNFYLSDFPDVWLMTYPVKPFDFSLLASYQLVCSHFYSNDSIDSVYSANILRNLFKFYIIKSHNFIDRSLSLSFNYNGATIDYDSFSGYYFSKMVDLLYLSVTSNNYVFHNYIFSYFYALFGTNKSLKFGDYFTGARPYPLAVGDVNITVNNSEVSAVDITRNIQLQRFLNNVNRAGRKFSDYLRSITDGKALPTPTNPKWLASQHYNIAGNEIENTSGSGQDSPQGNIVLNLRSQQSKYSLEYRDSEPSIVLGLCWFDAMRLYSRSVDRHFFREDRFDFFNKDMQYVGDQEIYGSELTLNPLNPTFAYTLRNMEDKQRVSIASGGFVRVLPSWAFVCDNDVSQNNKPTIISSDFIRSSNSEFDRFYKSLTHFDSSGYFHFIIYHYNQCEPVRPMAFAPSIL